MGNLRDNMTHEEWSDFQKRIKSERANGKPDTSILSLSLFNKSVEELKRLRKVLSDFYGEYELSELDRWITWNEKISK